MKINSIVRNQYNRYLNWNSTNTINLTTNAMDLMNYISHTLLNHSIFGNDNQLNGYGEDE